MLKYYVSIKMADKTPKNKIFGIDALIRG